MDPRKRNLRMVVSCICLYFGAILFVSVRLAMRDAEGAADFIFKVFGAGMALFFASAGPFGMIGLAAISGTAKKVPAGVSFLLAGIISVLLVLYVLKEFNAFSLFM